MGFPHPAQVSKAVEMIRPIIEMDLDPIQFCIEMTRVFSGWSSDEVTLAMFFIVLEMRKELQCRNLLSK